MAGAAGVQAWSVTREKMRASMLRFADDKRCPICGRKAALVVEGWSAGFKIYRCRWCRELTRVCA